SADLRALDARLGDERIGLLPSTRDYAERILSCRNDPFRLLAHHYTRYLGDLSGGQAMRVMLDRAYGLPDEQAAFFRFEEIGPIPPFKRRYRAALDRLELRRDDADRLVDEAIASFDCNARIFTDLEEIVATPRPALTA
ncbi:MAG: biliverdin-producing heme oxygenase, partial [Microbacteriaceae bacterium]|nr:biliverdin-producing heme oxygenase [Microbacteriaceae bacterium]